LALLAGLFALGVAVRWMTADAYLPWLAVAALALTMWRMFVPVEFELGHEGIDQQILGRRYRLPWTAIKRYEVLASGVLVLPAAAARPLDVLDGLFLPWANHRGEILAILERELGPAEEKLP
jgi:hypothetical protein